MDATAAATLFAWLDRELWLVTAQAEGRRGGLIATFVSQASSVAELPRVLVGVACQHDTWELIEASRSFALHLLRKENLELVWKFGLTSGLERDKFAGLVVQTAATGSPILSQTVGWLDCRVETRLDIGDRTLYLGEVLEGGVNHFAPPLTTQKLMELAPETLLTQMQRQRHHNTHREAEAIRQWREEQGRRE